MSRSSLFLLSIEGDASIDLNIYSLYVYKCIYTYIYIIYIYIYIIVLYIYTILYYINISMINSIYLQDIGIWMHLVQ